MKTTDQGWREQAAGRIANMLVKVQGRFASCLNKALAGVPKARMKVIVIGFCMVGGGFSVYLIAEALVNHPGNGFQIEQLRIPAHVNDSNVRNGYGLTDTIKLKIK